MAVRAALLQFPPPATIFRRGRLADALLANPVRSGRKQP